MTRSAMASVASIALLVFAAIPSYEQSAVFGQSAGNRIILAQYMRAVPAEACKRVCVKAGRGTDKIPAQCLQWQTVCK
jgi:hypothetical protein